MTAEDILMSPQLIKRFCRDYNVPVSTLQPPYFQNQLDTLSIHDPTYQMRFDEFVKEVTQYANADEYFAHYNEVKDSIINHIMSHPQFQSFSTMVYKGSNFSKKELYSELNHAKEFISIDLCKANFTIVNLNCPQLFEGKSWENVVEQFGGSSYLQHSKYIRQVIFGACNPKKQIQAQTAAMSDLATFLVSRGVNIYSVVTDEIIVEGGCFSDICNLVAAYTGLPTDTLKIERFFLTHTNAGYVKTILGSTDTKDIGKHKFKCVDGDYYCQFVKYFYGKEIEQSDLMFDYKGTIAQFLHPIENPWKELL